MPRHNLSLCCSMHTAVCADCCCTSACRRQSALNRARIGHAARQGVGRAKHFCRSARPRRRSETIFAANIPSASELAKMERVNDFLTTLHSKAADAVGFRGETRAGHVAAAVATLGVAAGVYAAISHVHQIRVCGDAMKRQVAVISGGSSGIGAGIARALVNHGVHKVIILARGQERLDATAASINATAGRNAVFTFRCDCSDALQVQQTVDDIVAQHGVPDILVNNAGAGAWKPLWECSEAEVNEAIDAPVRAYVNLTRAMLPHMLSKQRSAAAAGGEQHGQAQILFVQSPASRIVFPGTTAYTTARFAVRGLVAALRSDLRGTRIAVKELVLGLTETEFFARDPSATTQVLPGIAQLIPSQTADDAGAAALQLLKSHPGTHELVRPIPVAALVWMSDHVPGYQVLQQWLMDATGWKYDADADAKKSK